MPDKLSGTPIYRRAEGYVIASRYEIDDKNELFESVSSIDRDGHEHQLSRNKISKGKEKQILELHREHRKMLEKHGELLKQQIEELQKRGEEVAKQAAAMAEDIVVLEGRVGKAPSDAASEEKSEIEKSE